MSSSAVATPGLTAERAERALDELIRRRGIPGAGFAASRDGELVVDVAAGVGNVDTGLAVATDTIWQPGSIGKTYTAVLVMQLVDEGRLDLDAPVAEHLRELRFADAEVARTVTARQLLCHTGGIDGDRLDEDGSEFGRGDDAVRRYVDSLADLPQIVAPGRLWSYCNAGYVVLGRLVEVLRDSTYEQALTDHVLQPAGLSSTFCFAEQVIQRNVAAGHVPGPDGRMMVAPVWMPGRGNGPAGTAVVTTMADLIAFADILLRRGVARDGTRILSEASVAEMEKPHVACPEHELLGDQWGLGLLIRSGPPPVYGHDGNTHGQTASLRYIPESGIAVALVSNRSGANRAFSELCREIVDGWAGITTPEQQVAAEGVQARDAARLSGLYANIAAKLRVDGDSAPPTLSVSVTRDTNAGIDTRPRPLRALDDSTFLMHVDEAGEDMQVAFLEPDSQGQPRYIHFGGRLYRRT